MIVSLLLLAGVFVSVGRAIDALIECITDCGWMLLRSDIVDRRVHSDGTVDEYYEDGTALTRHMDNIGNHYIITERRFRWRPARVKSPSFGMG